MLDNNLTPIDHTPQMNRPQNEPPVIGRQPLPPPIPPSIPQKNKGTIKVFGLVALFCLTVIAVIVGMSLFSLLKEALWIHVTSSTGTFHPTILELKSEPNYFAERVRVRCEQDMTAEIWVADLSKAGILQTRGAQGEIYYRDGDADQVSQSVPVRAHDGFSTCDIVYTVQTTSTNTIWHSQVIAGGTSGVGTTFPVPMTVSGVQTNWPGSYQRGSEIPLANLGNYKIFLSVK